MLALCLREYRIYDEYVFTHYRRLWMIALVLSVGWVIARRFSRVPAPVARLAGLVPLFLPLLLVAVLHSRYVPPPSERSVAMLEDFLTASRVVRENTSESEATLAAPLIEMPMLEVTAGRASILQLVKAHIPYLAPALLPRFDATLGSFGIDIASFKGTWVDLVREAPVIWKRTATVERLRQLAADHHAKLVLTYGDHDLALPVLYRGSHFAIYRVSD